MYKNLVAVVLGINGLILMAAGVLIVVSSRSQLMDLGLEAAQIERITPTFYGLGLADVFSSLFSVLAMVWVYREEPVGRTLALVVGSYQFLVGVSLYLLTGLTFALYIIALRGAIIAALSWRLPGREA